MSFASVKVTVRRRGDLNRVRRNLDEILERAMIAGAGIVEGYAKINIEGQGLVDTGNLMGSPAVYGPRRDGGGVVVGVGTNVEYGKYHELGTRRGLPASPWLGPAVHGHRTEFEQVAGASAARDIKRLL